MVEPDDTRQAGARTNRPQCAAPAERATHRMVIGTFRLRAKGAERLIDAAVEAYRNRPEPM